MKIYLFSKNFTFFVRACLAAGGDGSGSGHVNKRFFVLNN
jgi:hypothetical protein